MPRQECLTTPFSEVFLLHFREAAQIVQHCARSLEARMKSMQTRDASSYYSDRFRTHFAPRYCQAWLNITLGAQFVAELMASKCSAWPWMIKKWFIKSSNSTALFVRCCLHFDQCSVQMRCFPCVTLTTSSHSAELVYSLGTQPWQALCCSTVLWQGPWALI